MQHVLCQITGEPDNIMLYGDGNNLIIKYNKIVSLNSLDAGITNSGFIHLLYINNNDEKQE